jgi:hypothetical protein
VLKALPEKLPPNALIPQQWRKEPAGTTGRGTRWLRARIVFKLGF